MVNGRNENYEGLENQEEGEYHFADDQINYEVETETPKTVEQPATIDMKQTVLAGLNRYRRVIIGLVVFFILIFIIYKLLSPTSGTPATDFSQAPTQTTTKAESKTITTSTAAAPTMAIQPPAVASVPFQPTQQVSQTLPESLPTPQAQGGNMPTVSQPMPSNPAQPQPSQQQSIPAQTMEMPVSQMPQSQMLQSQMPSQNMPPQTLPSQSIQSPTMMPANPMASAPPEMAGMQKNVLDRLAALEEENAKLVSILQTQFAQKMAEYEMQNNANQEKMLLLNKRLGNIEASLTKMAQLLRDDTVNKAPMMATIPSMPMVKPVVPKIIYTVQAIIPGRAWLKSDAGETVTVAEGDMLKDYGRITKIDPYDGVVDIDTGRKVISLSYGSSGD